MSLLSAPILSPSAVEDALTKVNGQTVVEFDVNMLPDRTVEFDFDTNGVLEMHPDDGFRRRLRWGREEEILLKSLE